jgi:FUN14 domain-containing protein 1
MADPNTDPVESALDKLKPILSQVSFGSVLGYCSGMSLKKLGKAAAFVIGVGFIGVQSAVHAGYINVNWTKIKDDAIKPLDTVSFML